MLEKSNGNIKFYFLKYQFPKRAREREIKQLEIRKE